jgi:hypothetical protein
VDLRTQCKCVKTALEKWKLRELFDGGGQPIETRTGLRFHFVFEDGNRRVDVANEQEQFEFGGEWGKRFAERRSTIELIPKHQLNCY